MRGTILILIGLALTVGSVAVGYYVISAGCAADGASGCQAGIIELVSALMISNEGIFFYLAWVVGIFCVWGGMRLRAAGR